MLNHNKYLHDFTKDLISNSSNFIASAWIVNKFLDMYYVLSLPLNDVKSTILARYSDSSTFLNLQDGLERNISELDMCIETLNEERELVKLEIMKEKPVPWNIL